MADRAGFSNYMDGGDGHYRAVDRLGARGERARNVELTTRGGARRQISK